MLAIFTRRLKRPKHSFFLVGPRGTGKSTWLRQVLEKARWYDLLHSPVEVVPVREFFERLPTLLR